MMDVREQFRSEEFLRYAAECSRLARLARRDNKAIAAHSTAWIDWLKQAASLPSRAALQSAEFLNYRVRGQNFSRAS
jgi:hypothetical protein